MAQAAAMGPPLSPRETRRSGRRSAPSVSASASKSPDSDQPPRDKAASSRTAPSSNNNRNRKLKQEEYEDGIDERKQYAAAPAASTSGSNNGSNKAKRKAKEKDKTSGVGDVEAASADSQAQEPPEEDEEEQGITRCVCGSAEDDPDAGEFMVQCETCKVWQHGLCMGYQSEDQVHDDDYYCELCRPELHTDLLKKLAKRPRQTSATSRQDPAANPRVSRSHSPSHLLKQHSKRRNTMNSRDAAFDESLKEIIEATAAEAAAVDPSANDTTTTITPPESSEASKKKRKRVEDDIASKKRTRSASTVSEAQSETAQPLDPPAGEKAVAHVIKPSGGRNKRGARKVATVEATSAEMEEAAQSATTKRPGNNARNKNLASVKRPPLSHSISQSSGPNGHEHGTRRNQLGGGQLAGTSAADARAYRNSHAYAVSQQTLFTSWNLPDYLSHLEQMLPSHTPQPLEVRSGGAGATPGSRGGSAELTMERGVKVKWPAKRMSVGDMNKRVRALVEWVGREQANALDRGRRREALEIALREQETNQVGEETGTNDVPMVVDDTGSAIEQVPHTTKPPFEAHLMSEGALQMSGQTMKTMEELMEELIGFQERFGPGAKHRERERRLGAT